MNSTTSFMRRFFFYSRVHVILLLVLITGFAAYLIYSKKTTTQEDMEVVSTTGEENKKGIVTPPLEPQLAAEVKNTVVNGPAPEKRERKEDVTEKMRYPFSAHVMTEDEKVFKETAMTTQPVSNVIVHDTGVVFFWAEPKDAGNIQKRKKIMENLAHIYKDSCLYEKPVTVVFLISGRPVQSHKFFNNL